jgi:E3 ubiquitin-protein ligase MARCH6
MLGAPNRIMGLLLSLFFAACVVRESVVRFTTLWSWRVAVARTFAQVHRLLSLGLSTTSIITLIPLWVLFAQKLRPSAVAPFTRWVQRMEARLHGLRGFDGLQVVALFTVEGLLWVYLFFLNPCPTVNDNILLFFHSSKVPINAAVFCS